MSRELLEGEDLGFCMKVNKLGLKFFTDFSIQCNHFKKVGLQHVNDYAINMRNAAVLGFNEEVKSKVEALMGQNIYLKRVISKLKETRDTGPKVTKSGLILPK